MRMLCDACHRPTMPGITNVQLQTGHPVMGVGGFNMKLTRQPEFFVLCDPCAEYVTQYARYVVRSGGAPALEAQAAEAAAAEADDEAAVRGTSTSAAA